VPKGSFALWFFVLSSALPSAQVGSTSLQAQPDLSNAVSGGALTCTQASTFVEPYPLLEKAKLKARLLILLRDSLFDDANGIVNIARGKKIKQLADKLKLDRSDELGADGVSATEDVENKPANLACLLASKWSVLCIATHSATFRCPTHLSPSYGLADLIPWVQPGMGRA
jgi:hypothetical protein